MWITFRWNDTVSVKMTSKGKKCVIHTVWISASKKKCVNFEEMFSEIPFWEVVGIIASIL